ncbi:hypothetical protein [Hyunsoonleella ulvae]|uniref:hypothetical protein n=1 Tax=Hyunsoonleella ulvae TaxID=2799948 RepID=UPI00193ACDF1|nr:hypothetical protein [Hyunsoonleella ulvae]
MKLLRSIDKVLAGFGNMKAMKRTHVDTYTENLISKIEGEKIAESEYGQLFVSYQDLAGYKFLNATILSGTNIKTYKGASLVFTIGNKEVVLLSDTQEIESDFSNVSNRWMTKISFVISDDNRKMIGSKTFEKICLNFKKRSLPLLN